MTNSPSPCLSKDERFFLATVREDMITVDEKRERGWTFGSIVFLNFLSLSSTSLESIHLITSHPHSESPPSLQFSLVKPWPFPIHQILFSILPMHLTLKVCSSKPLSPRLFQLFIALSVSFFASLLCPSPQEKWLLQPKGTALVVNYHSANWLRQTDSFSSSCFLCFFSHILFLHLTQKTDSPQQERQRDIKN